MQMEAEWSMAPATHVWRQRPTYGASDPRMAPASLLDRIGRRATLKARFTSNPVCLQCHYDLTGNLSGRCPECAAPIAEVTGRAGPARVADPARGIKRSS